MISIIVCSVNPEAVSALERNIGTTIGCEYEILAFDNRQSHRGICSVYNEQAAKARGEYLCFVHEDVLFVTQGWDAIITAQLDTPGCGFIGFAGSTMKSSVISGWGTIAKYYRYSYTQHFNDGRIEKRYLNPDNEDFSRVAVLDGFCMFCRREVWEECRFDADLYPGFHLYDIDITTHAALKYSNYVCNIIDIEHMSEGTLSDEWLEHQLLYLKKWHKQLPIYIQSPGWYKRVKYEGRASLISLQYIVESAPRVPWYGIQLMFKMHMRRFLFNRYTPAFIRTYLKARKQKDSRPE